MNYFWLTTIFIYNKSFIFKYDILSVYFVNIIQILVFVLINDLIGLNYAEKFLYAVSINNSSVKSYFIKSKFLIKPKKNYSINIFTIFNIIYFYI